jgi:hypothetical protein
MLKVQRPPKASLENNCENGSEKLKKTKSSAETVKGFRIGSRPSSQLVFSGAQ